MQSKNINPNAIFYTYWFEDWTFQLSLLKAEHKIKTLISRIHGGDVYEYQHQEADFFFPFRNFQIHCLNKIVGISDDGLKHIKQNYPDSAEKLALSRLGTKDYGLCPINSGAKEFVLVSCSSFYHFKNVTLIPKILALLKFRLHWIHIGNEGPELDAVMEAVKKLPEGISTEFKGQLSPKAVFEFYKQTPVDLFINTSISEGLPVSLMEAISFGIPIVAPNVGGIKEITNDKTGILFDLKTSPAELAAVISKIHNGTIVFDRMAVRKFWEENYHAEKNHNNFSEQLEQLLCAG
jgi:glycosyltransferase involved in cell wall biosynthesis